MPPRGISVGIAFVVLFAAVAYAMMRKPELARRRGVFFAVTSPVLSAAAWLYSWAAASSGTVAMNGGAIGLHLGLLAVSIAAIFVVWRTWARRRSEGVGRLIPVSATISTLVVLSSLLIPVGLDLLEWAGTLLLVGAVPVSVALAGIVPWVTARKRLPVAERPSYLGILRPALAVCLAWILALQFASLIWLGAWRAKAAGEIERAYATSENQAVLQIMEKSQRRGTAP